MKIATFSGIDGIDGPQWDALVRGRYPFLQHGFLSAMERHGCVGAGAGWIPRHLGCFEDGRLVGGMPLYEKHNSWGEFVFDHAWADAFQRAGIEYYPKLVNAIPFTPACGPRAPARESGRGEIVRALLGGARELMGRGGFSGVHSLFVEADEFELLNTAEAVTRVDCQFHWHNRGYRDFEEFLGTLKAKKRKNIRRERARVAQSGVVIRRLDGHHAGAREWQDFSRLYRGIYDRKYGYPAFNEGFFAEVAALMPDQVQLVMAYRGGRGDEAVAAALMYLDDHTCTAGTGDVAATSTACISRSAITRALRSASSAACGGSTPAPRANTKSRAASPRRPRARCTGWRTARSPGPSASSPAMNAPGCGPTSTRCGNIRRIIGVMRHDASRYSWLACRSRNFHGNGRGAKLKCPVL